MAIFFVKLHQNNPKSAISGILQLQPQPQLHVFTSHDLFISTVSEISYDGLQEGRQFPISIAKVESIILRVAGDAISITS